MPVVSYAMENYVAAIWRLTRGGGAASTSEVARQLGVTPASTSYMFKKMAEAGLAEHREYAGVTLTRAGEQAAMGYIRRHRVIERFLVDVLGVGWERVDGFTDQMEHSLPDEVVERMSGVLGNPTACPHGYPIPSLEGRMPERRLRLLSDLLPGQNGTIAQVAEHDPNLLVYFGEHGLRPGRTVALEEKDPLGETMTFRVEERSEPFVLGSAIARLIHLEA